MFILEVFGIIGLLIIATMIAISGFMGAPWVPAYTRDIDAMLDDAKLRPGEHFVELGCGDGRLLIAAAHRGAYCTGYEINPLMWAVATIRTMRYPKVHVRFGNLWRVNLANADVVMAFLMPKFMPRLKTKVVHELHPDARCISYVFELPLLIPTVKRHHWYIYMIGHAKSE
jgi:SAM-dependent methyltransferase